MFCVTLNNYGTFIIYILHGLYVIKHINDSTINIKISKGSKQIFTNLYHWHCLTLLKLFIVCKIRAAGTINIIVAQKVCLIFRTIKYNMLCSVYQTL